jgi:hypothetical protein
VEIALEDGAHVEVVVDLTIVEHAVVVHGAGAEEGGAGRAAQRGHGIALGEGRSAFTEPVPGPGHDLEGVGPLVVAQDDQDVGCALLGSGAGAKWPVARLR